MRLLLEQTLMHNTSGISSNVRGNNLLGMGTGRPIMEQSVRMQIRKAEEPSHRQIVVQDLVLVVGATNPLRSCGQCLKRRQESSMPAISPFLTRLRLQDKLSTKTCTRSWHYGGIL